MASQHGVVVPNAPHWHQRLGAWLVFALVRSVSATLRYRWHDRSGFYDQPPADAAIYCVWHNRLALCLELYYRYTKQRVRTPGLAAMVSASRATIDTRETAVVLRILNLRSQSTNQ